MDKGRTNRFAKPSIPLEQQACSAKHQRSTLPVTKIRTPPTPSYLQARPHASASQHGRNPPNTHRRRARCHHHPRRLRPCRRAPFRHDTRLGFDDRRDILLVVRRQRAIPRLGRDGGIEDGEGGGAFAGRAGRLEHAVDGGPFFLAR